MTLEQFILDLIQGQRKPPFVKGVLKGASQLYRLGVALRHLAYDKGFLTPFKASRPVISVGNISCGGTGKTPLVRLLAEELLKINSKGAILSRGYRSQSEKKKEVAKVDLLLPVELYGDEPYWLALQMPEVAVWVGRERHLSAQKASGEARWLLLDDGLQHRQLARDLEVIALDGEDLFGGGHFLPRGFLRDSRERLKVADLLVVTRLQDLLHYERVKAELLPYSNAPVVGMKLQVIEAKEMEGKRTAIFCGIARPQRFVETLKQLQVQEMDRLFLADHGVLKSGRLESFAMQAKAKGAEVLICTEKDHVKLPRNLSLPLPLYPLKTKLEVAYGKHHWQNFIEILKAKLGEYERRI